MAKKKILIVDDEPSVLKIVKRRLEASNYDVVTALDGVDGLQAVFLQKPDLVISDIMMPNMDGYTFVKALRANPAAARIPVLILTAKEKLQDLFFFQGVKDVDYLVKPFESEALLQKITELLVRVETYLGPDQEPESTPGPAQPS